MSSEPALPSLVGVSPPSSRLIDLASNFLKQHTALSTTNHCIRSAYWALILASKLPQFKSFPVNEELVVYACLMHDLGWATTKELVSEDKRFEVDGANQAVRFLTDHPEIGKWDKHQLEVLWTAIALHTTPSIANHYPDPHVAIVGIGILADFFGPNLPPPFPPGLLSAEEFQAVIRAYPRANFKNDLVGILCGLCRDKPQTVMDNFVVHYGLKFGLDGKGTGKEDFIKQVEAADNTDRMLAALDKTAEFE